MGVRATVDGGRGQHGWFAGAAWMTSGELVALPVWRDGDDRGAFDREAG